MKYTLTHLFFIIFISQICLAQNESCPEYLQPVGGITNGTFKANNAVNSNGIILQNNTVKFKAGESIQLRSGFSTKANTNFSADVENCNFSSAATANALSFSSVPQSVSEGTAYTVEVNYQLMETGLLHLILTDENWNKIGEIWAGNLPAGSFTESLNFIVTGPPSSTTNYLQVRLLKANWEELDVNLIEQTIPGASNNGLSNAIDWINFPQTISAGSTYTVDLIYGLQQSGLIYLLLMNENWEKIGEVISDPLNAGNNTISLPITVDGTPSNGNNYIQAQLLDSNWGNIGIDPIQETITSNNNPDPNPNPNINGFDWVNTPTSVSTGSTYPVEVSYTLNQPGLIYLILMDNNWNKIGEDIVNLTQGSGIANLSLEVTGNHSPNNNYLQASLFDVNWESVGESMISKILPGGVADINSIEWSNVNDLPNSINMGETYTIDIQYNLNVAGLVYLQMMDANFIKIGEIWSAGILNPGSGVEQLSLTIDDPPSNGNNYIQAQLFDQNWGDIDVNAIQQTINNTPNNGSAQFGEFSNDDPQLTEYHSIFPLNCNESIYNTFENGSPNPQNKQLTSSEGIYIIDPNECDNPDSGNICPHAYATNWYVGCEWRGPIKAYWGPIVPLGNNNFGGTNFWMEWENQQLADNNGYTPHAETDVRAHKHQWAYSSGEHGYPKQIRDLINNNIDVTCTANGQWAAGSAGRGHVNLTVWVAETANSINEVGDDTLRCDIIIHIWDNSGNMSANEGFDFINEGNAFNSGDLEYDIIQRSGDEGEKASFNIVPRIDGISMDERIPITGNYPDSTTIAKDYSINVMDFIIYLRDNATDDNGNPIFTNDWYLAGADWTITAQSAKKFDGDGPVNNVTIPPSKGRWTFNEYYVPDLE